MANRFPLVINNSSTVVGELQAGDALNLSSSGIFDGSGTGTNGQYLQSTGSGQVSWATAGDVYLTATQTLQNKTFSSCIFNALSNTLSNVPNSSLVNSTITINGSAVPLGGTATLADTNTTYTLATASSSIPNAVLINLTAGGSGTLANSSYNIIGSNITVSKDSTGNINLSPSLGILTFSNYVTGSSTYDGTSATTITINADSSASTNNLVARDSNGAFTAGVITVGGLSSTGTISVNTVSASTISSSGTVSGTTISGTSFVKTNGTSSQFLKADGSVDSNTYLTTYTDTLNTVTGRGNTTTNNISVGTCTATSFVKSGGTSTQFLKADGSIDSNTYVTEAFASGTTLLFYQAAAPAGWTKVTTHNDKSLRVVSGTGGGYGGSISFSNTFNTKVISGTVGNTTLTLSQIPGHTHGINDPGHVHSGAAQWPGSGPEQNQSGGPEDRTTFNINTGVSTTGITVQSSGGDGSHTHTFSGNSIDFSIQYIDVIICSKN
jgi:hypothetical protein